MPSFNVRKSVLIQAPIEEIYANVRDFKRWRPWSPWLLAEPDCKVTYADDGRSYSWDGKIIGAGEIGVVSEAVPHKLSLKLVFLRPWKSVASVWFDLQPRGDAVEVVWSMESSLPIFLFWMRSMMAAFIGMDYARGLAMLKDQLETGSVPSRLDFLGPQESPAIHYVGIRQSCPMEAIGERMGVCFERLHQWFKETGLEPAGNGLSVYHDFKVTKGIMDFTAALPVARPVGSLPPDFVSGDLPATKAYCVRHTGAYRHLGNAWAAGQSHQQAKVFRAKRKLPSFEVYENDCAQTEEAALVTTVKFPMR